MTTRETRIAALIAAGAEVEHRAAERYVPRAYCVVFVPELGGGCSSLDCPTTSTPENDAWTVALARLDERDRRAGLTDAQRDAEDRTHRNRLRAGAAYIDGDERSLGCGPDEY
jgi:hypothetical protein